MQILINILISAAIYTLAGLSFALIFNTARFFHFAHSVVFTIGAYSTYLLMVKLNYPFVVAMVGSFVVVFIIACLFDLTVYRPLRGRHSSNSVLLLASLGLLIALQNFISLIFGDETKSLRIGKAWSGLEIWEARITSIQLIIIIVSFALSTILWIIINKTKAGKIVQAVSMDPELSVIFGIRPDRVIRWVFVLGSLMAALTGILMAFDSDMTPSMGFNVMLMGVIAVIVGGKMNFIGTCAASLLIGIVQHIVAWRLSTQWQYAIVFAILILFLIIRPQGLFGKPLRSASV